MSESKFSDPSDRKEASYRPDMAAELDTLDDLLKDAIARWKGDLPGTRAEFNAVVFSIFTEAIRDALGEGASVEMIIQRYADEQTDERVWAAIAAVIAELRADRSPVIAMDSLAHASGLMALQGETMTQTAKRHLNPRTQKPLERATISKRAVHWCRKLGLRPSRGMKSEDACEVYSQLKTEAAAAGL